MNRYFQYDWMVNTINHKKTDLFDIIKMNNSIPQKVNIDEKSTTIIRKMNNNEKEHLITKR